MAAMGKVVANDAVENGPRDNEWYPLRIGETMMNGSKSTLQYYTLRYDFKPASVDRTKPGSMFKDAENKIIVEFRNNQAGKPKVGFQGINEQCKELEGIVFFDGKEIRLERLSRAVKSLRHIRTSTTDASSSQAGGLGASSPELPLDLIGNGGFFNGNNNLPGGVAVERISLNGGAAGVPSSVPEVKNETVTPKVSAGGKRKKTEGSSGPKVRKQKAAACTAPLPPPAMHAEEVDILGDLGDDHHAAVSQPEKLPEVGEVETIEVGIEEVGEEDTSDYELNDFESEEEGEACGGLGTGAAVAPEADAAVAIDSDHCPGGKGEAGSSSSSGSSDSGSDSGSVSESGSDSDSGSDGCEDDDEDSASSGDD
ncbi:hypothetical protein CBR_g81558 [Chara braunii]|uniref:Transcription elongation factor Eaf N-terminal domain-containing protein n=1 Tax=Chara braunii TaxID=69332 RepID=A0A388KAP4_CHABU|nr:hypothetical protein CBR_g81558 [Chara braunii]|eukprot:GBG67134.1 hypothetical protein CBR_g81558 [Chara braunii]